MCFDLCGVTPCVSLRSARDTAKAGSINNGRPCTSPLQTYLKQGACGTHARRTRDTGNRLFLDTTPACCALCFAAGAGATHVVRVALDKQIEMYVALVSYLALGKHCPVCQQTKVVCLDCIAAGFFEAVMWAHPGGQKPVWGRHVVYALRGWRTRGGQACEVCRFHASVRDHHSSLHARNRARPSCSPLRCAAGEDVLHRDEACASGAGCASPRQQGPGISVVSKCSFPTRHIECCNVRCCIRSCLFPGGRQGVQGHRPDAWACGGGGGGGGAGGQGKA